MSEDATKILLPLYKEETRARILRAREAAEEMKGRKAHFIESHRQGGVFIRNFMVQSFTTELQMYYQSVLPTPMSDGYCYSQGLAPLTYITCSCPVGAVARKPCKHAALVQIALEKEAAKEQKAIEKADRLVALFEAQMG